MKRNTLFSILALFAGALIAAESTPKDDVINAAKKLGDQANYSWKTTTVVPDGARFRPGPMDGKTEKDGFTLVSGRFGDNTWEMACKGDKAALTSPDGGWESVAELEKDEGMGRFRAAMARNLKVPATQAADVAATVKELKKDGDVYVGELTEAGAKDLLTWRRGGGDGPTVSNAKGSAKFWLKDGMLVKYELKVSGTVSFNGNDMETDRTTTVEIKNIGDTKIEVPEEAKKKLG